jgi:flagellar biosynthetic protein FlhB
VARSRELSAALASLAVIMFVAWRPLAWGEQWRELFRQGLSTALSGDISLRSPVMHWTIWTVLRWGGPPIVLAWILAVAGSLVQTGLVFATDALTPNFSRLNPAQNLGKLFSVAGLSNLLKSLVPMAVILYLVAAMFSRDWGQVLQLVHAGPRHALAFIMSRLYEISWKEGLVFLVWAAVDYALARFNYEKSLRMTQQEIREETKDVEGNPTIKGRLRRMQRQMRRRLILDRVRKATVVVTNPTHYAVALEYRPGEMEAPVVVAKGRDLIAKRIRDEARWYEIPIIENPPLAQALYRAVEIGQTIPAKLYAAVAEILAIIFRAQMQAQARAGGAAPEEFRRA